ncbi:MAG: hypothetical protein ACR2Q3_10750, partial [Woeseiaceae bacterium]
WFVEQPVARPTVAVAAKQPAIAVKRLRNSLRSVISPQRLSSSHFDINLGLDCEVAVCGSGSGDIVCMLDFELRRGE